MRPNAFGGTTRSCSRAPITRTVEDAALGMTALAGHDPRDPFSLRRGGRLHSARCDRAIEGMRIAYSPRPRRLPGRPPRRRRVADAVRAFEEAGATSSRCTLGITRTSASCRDLWCRLIMPINIATIEDRSADRLDDHATTCPPEYLRWLDLGYELRRSTSRATRPMRTEVYDAIQGVFADYDLLVTPDARLHCRSPNADDGNTVGPSEIDGERSTR